MARWLENLTVNDDEASLRQFADKNVNLSVWRQNTV